MDLSWDKPPVGAVICDCGHPFFIPPLADDRPRRIRCETCGLETIVTAEMLRPRPGEIVLITDWPRRSARWHARLALFALAALLGCWLAAVLWIVLAVLQALGVSDGP